MFPRARGECFNGDVATLECSQVESGERRLERLSAECDHKDKDKNRAREARQSPLLHWSTSRARVWPLLRCFALISQLMKSRTALYRVYMFI